MKVKIVEDQPDTYVQQGSLCKVKLSKGLNKRSSMKLIQYRNFHQCCIGKFFCAKRGDVKVSLSIVGLANLRPKEESSSIKTMQTT